MKLFQLLIDKLSPRECAGCGQSRDKQQAMRSEAMKKHGWVIEYVNFDPEAPNNFNCHTHGLFENFGHLDLQICLPLSDITCSQFMHIIVADIKKGKKFEVDTDYTEFFESGHPLKFITALECGRQVLRLVFPDKNGTYIGEEFQSQFAMTDNHGKGHNQAGKVPG